MRSTAKFCQNGHCRQRYNRDIKNDVDNKHSLDMMQANNLLSNVLGELFDNKHDPDMQASMLEYVESINYICNRMYAYIGTVQAEQANTWYQCQDCGQRTFGKVDNCDFCKSSNFKPITHK